jgi:hypothetical protein
MGEMNYMDELWDGWKWTVLIQLAKWGEMNYMGWTLRMYENWTTLIQLAKWGEMNYMDELWEWMKIDHVNTLGEMGEMNYMDELWEWMKVNLQNEIHYIRV